MKIYYTVPSYHRSNEQLTIDYLSSLGIDEVYLSVQNKEDAENYQKYADKVKTIIYREGSNVSDNRNAILDYFPKNACIVQFDDDIKNISTLQVIDGKNKLNPILDGKTFKKLFEKMFKVAIRRGGKIFGVYPVSNAFFMKQVIRDVALVEGTVIGIVNSNLRFNSNYPLKEDYAFSCEHINRYGSSYRFDFVTANAKHRTKGGCKDFWDTEQENVFKRFIKQYGKLVKPNPTRKNEILLKKMHTLK